MTTNNSINAPTNQFLQLTGGTLSGALNLGANLINNLANPLSAQDASTKYYVDSVAQGLNPKPASAAATTANLTATYNNGTAGVGATLTNSGALAAFAVDGYSASAGDVILVKDQSTSAQNGLYTVTTVGSGAVAWVLTRSTSMDAPAEFKGGYTFVINGTVNNGRSFVETATVTTVGTDAVTFVQFSQSKQLSVVSQVITATGSSTYTPTTGMAYCIVQLVGGGGAGGSGASGGAGTTGLAAGGGGGGYCQKIYTAAQIGASATVVVGAGGTAGAAGNNAGNSGANSTFTPAGGGAILTASAGGGGNGTASFAGSGNSSAPGAGGSGTNGDININGAYGAYGVTVNGSTGIATGGNGGSSILGTGAILHSLVASADGIAGSNYGSGGSGAFPANANQVGGVGAQGICIITEFVLS